MSSSREEVALLPEELGMYVDSVRERHSGIEEVWVLRRPTDDDSGQPRCWKLLAVANAAVLDALRNDSAARRDDVELLVVTDGNHFDGAWGAAKPGTLTGIGWRLDDARSAVYEERGVGSVVATRVR